MPDGSVGVHVKQAVINGLTDLFVALPDFNGGDQPEREVEVTYGYRFDSNATERVYAGRSTGDTPPAALRSGRNHRQESGTFDLIVMVRLIGGDAYEADLRAAAIGDQVEAWIGDRKNGEALDVDGLQTLLVTSWESDYAGIDGGTGSIRTYRVQWTARLT